MQLLYRTNVFVCLGLMRPSCARVGTGLGADQVGFRLGFAWQLTPDTDPYYVSVILTSFFSCYELIFGISVMGEGPLLSTGKDSVRT